MDILFMGDNMKDKSMNQDDYKNQIIDEIEERIDQNMIKRIFTGNYDTCKAGNLISISGDRGKSAGFKGRAMPILAPKRKFWNVWHDNICKIPEVDNDRYYLEQYL